MMSHSLCHPVPCHPGILIVAPVSETHPLRYRYVRLDAGILIVAERENYTPRGRH